MNTSASAIVELPSARGALGRHLYLGTALALFVLVYVAFTRTFWTPLAGASLALHPAIVVHAVLFFLWTAFFVVQTWLPLAGRTALHRDLGLLGIALAAMMVFSGILAAIVSLKAGLPGLRPEGARTGAVLSFGAMTLFSTFVVFAVANIRRPEIHKRLMLLATLSILQAAIARLIMLVPSITQPQRVVLGTVIVDVLILAIVVLDARARGRVHPVFVAGGVFIVSVQYLRSQLLGTDAWATFCAWLAALGT